MNTNQALYIVQQSLIKMQQIIKIRGELRVFECMVGSTPHNPAMMAFLNCKREKLTELQTNYEEMMPHLQEALAYINYNYNELTNTN